MWDFASKKLIFTSFYYFCLVFLAACSFYDIFLGEISGFTFGYIFSFFYFLMRTFEVSKLLEEYDDEE